MVITSSNLNRFLTFFHTGKGCQIFNKMSSFSLHIKRIATISLEAVSSALGVCPAEGKVRSDDVPREVKSSNMSQLHCVPANAKLQFVSSTLHEIRTWLPSMRFSLSSS